MFTLWIRILRGSSGDSPRCVRGWMSGIPRIVWIVDRWDGGSSIRDPIMSVGIDVFSPPSWGGNQKNISPPWSRIMGGKGNVPPHGLERWGGNAFPPHKMGGRIFHSPPSYAISPPISWGGKPFPPHLMGGKPPKMVISPPSWGGNPKNFRLRRYFSSPPSCGESNTHFPPIRWGGKGKIAPPRSEIMGGKLPPQGLRLWGGNIDFPPMMGG